MEYRETWDLTTIPDPEWNKEAGRRNRLKVATPNVKLKPCKGGCGTMLNATQRRKPCPKCGYRHSWRETRPTMAG